uniref:Ig-like domain-containing protein n=1 Tax=Oncorhynchus mykiss TaxID=8022 RepID=A0A8K9UVJ3_ONCMY
MQNSSIYGQGPAKTQCRLLFVKGIFTVYGFVFGSGTRLYVTGKRSIPQIFQQIKKATHVQKPKVTVYPASNPEPNGKTTLLCLARDMFPDLVKISWKMEDEYSRTMEVEGQTTSMIIIDNEKIYRNKYICSVEHEGGPQDVFMLKGKASH